MSGLLCLTLDNSSEMKYSSKGDEFMLAYLSRVHERSLKRLKYFDLISSWSVHLLIYSGLSTHLFPLYSLPYTNHIPDFSGSYQ